MATLRDYWFPILLTLLGSAVGTAAAMTEGSARRIWLGLSATLVYLATMSFIFGDPVRGPFYGAIHPSKGAQFKIYAGVTGVYDIKRLAHGIDFSQLVNMPGRPIRLGEYPHDATCHESSHSSGPRFVSRF